MSDDMWRERRDRDDFSEYGSLFDDAEPTQVHDVLVDVREVADHDGAARSEAFRRHGGRIAAG